MKNWIDKWALAMLLSLLLTSCKTTETIVKIEKKIDTVKIEKTIVDTVFHEKVIEKTKEIKSNFFLPCPKEGEKGSSGRNESGDNYTEWEYDEDKGGYNVELYYAEQINQKDSIIRKLKEEIDTYKSSSKESKSEKEKVTEKRDWWNEFFKSIWKFLFFIILMLWLFGITPKWILKKLL